MDMRDAIYHRRSIRDYQDHAPSRERITQLIADAAQAPNSINRQAWAFTVVTGRERLAELSREAKAHAVAAPSTYVPAGLRDLLGDPDFNIFYNAPVLIVVSATSADVMVAQDCCLAAQTLMLSAHARELGTCWIGFAEGWLNTAEAKKRLGIAQDHQPIAPIILGHPRTQPQPPGRRTPQIAWIGGES
jgi:nitroreductase